MTRRFLPLFVLALLLPAWVLGADEPPAGSGDGPMRLKRKKRDAEPAPKEGKPKKDSGNEKEPAAKPKGVDEEPLVPEDPAAGGEPEEDEKDILQRVGRNMRAVEEKLGNRELGEPTRQQQRDILRDIDTLLKKSEDPNGGGGGGQPPPQGEMGGEEKNDQAGQQKQGGGQARSQRMGKGGQREQRRQRQARQRASSRNSTARNSPGGEAPSTSRSGDGESTKNPRPKPQRDDPLSNGNTKTLNATWGHLPESIRAEMNAYSNPQPFLPRYDRLIREYYKTIAEQGCKKGD